MTVPLVVDYLEHQKLTNVFNNLDQESHNKTYKSMKVKGVSDLKAHLDYSYHDATSVWRFEFFCSFGLKVETMWKFSSGLLHFCTSESSNNHSSYRKKSRFSSSSVKFLLEKVKQHLKKVSKSVYWFWWLVWQLCAAIMSWVGQWIQLVVY